MADEQPKVYSGALKFNQGAQVYEKTRPQYPQEALSFLQEECGFAPSYSVLDLAAGTGKLTRMLVPLFDAGNVSAVEPMSGMREQFVSVESLTGVNILEGTAESIPFGDSSFDAVFVAQAFHWFKPGEALVEIHRVLKTGGHLCLLWNKDTSLKDPLHQKIRDVVWSKRPLVGTPQYRDGLWKAPFIFASSSSSSSLPTASSSSGFDYLSKFSPLEHKKFKYQELLPIETLLQRMTSISYIAGLPKEEKENVVRDLLAELESDERTKGKSEINFLGCSDVFWCKKV